MTSKLAKPSITVIPYREVLPKGFICPAPEYRQDGMYQAPIIDECGHVLRDHFSARPEVFIDTGGFVFYDSLDLNLRVRPDIYIAFGVDAAAILARNGYLIEEAGKAPDFVLEVESESTHTVDTDADKKPAFYSRIGVSEYWRFDPTGGDFYGYALAGDILVNGAYQYIPVTAGPGEMTWGYSPALNLNLCAQGGRLVFHDPDTGQYLLNLPETKSALAAANAESERLREELRRLRGQ